MTAELRDWFIKLYCQLSRFDEPINEGQPKSSPAVATPTTTWNGMRTECRRLCAYNLPVFHNPIHWIQSRKYYLVMIVVYRMFQHLK